MAAAVALFATLLPPAAYLSLDCSLISSKKTSAVAAVLDEFFFVSSVTTYGW
jgi:hypothetical protein